MPSPSRLVPAAVLFVLSAARVGAQGEEVDTGERRGMMGTIGGSFGTAGVSCVPKCSADRQSGPVLLIRGGGRLGPQFSIIVEADVFRREFPDETGKGRWAMSWYMIGTQWYP